MASVDHAQLVERMVLSAPRAAREVQILSQVILAVSVLSIVGAGWIILSFVCKSIDETTTTN